MESRAKDIMFSTRYAKRQQVDRNLIPPSDPTTHKLLNGTLDGRSIACGSILWFFLEMTICCMPASSPGDDSEAAEEGKARATLICAETWF